MAELLFKRGLHADLPTKAQDGAFYLTTDTHRLYAGIGENLVDLNKYIHIVAGISALPATAQKGDFYYATSENVLCVRLENGSWQQINKNTDTTNSALTVTGEGNAVKIAVKDSQDTVKSDTIAFTGAKGIGTAVAATDGTVTVTGTLYELGGALASGTYTITLSPDGTSTTETNVKLKAGSNVTFTNAADGSLEIAAADTYVTSTGSSVAVGKGTDGKSKIAVTIADTAGNKATVSEEGSLYYTVNGETIYNQNALPVYSKSQIDEKFNNLNPMSYQGTVSAAADLDGKTGVKAGDTYMVATGFTYKGQAAKAGDLFIATGAENSSGVITTVTWTYVPSGDDAQTDTTYYGVATTASNLLTIKDMTETSVASHQLTGDDKITVTSTAVAHNGKNNAGLNVTIKHAEVGAVNTNDPKGSEENADKVVAVKSVTVDTTGHVTALETHTYNLKGYNLQNTTVASAENSNIATVTTAMKGTDDSAAGKVEFAIDASANDSLNVTAEGTNVKMSLVWGEF